MDHEEREVRFHDPMPKGYSFVPKGDVYITKNCRKTTHEAGKTLFVVVDKKNRPIGLRCPTYIFDAVKTQSKATATQRAEAVKKRDAAIEDNFEEAVVKLFPTIPAAEVQQVLKHSLKKNSRRVGRTSKVALHDRVKLAVRAHIRHMHTDYDKLLKQGMSRQVAREKIWERLNEVAMHWGGRPLKPTAARGEERGARRGKPAMSSAGARAKANGAVKKAAVHTTSVVTCRMSREKYDLPSHVPQTVCLIPRRLGTAGRQIRQREVTGARPVLGNEEIIVIDDDNDDGNGESNEKVNGAVGEVGMQDAVFAGVEETSGYESDGSEWSNWSDGSLGGGKGRRKKYLM